MAWPQAGRAVTVSLSIREVLVIRRCSRWSARAGLVLALLLPCIAYAGDAPPTRVRQDLVLNGDAQCTRCHDEGDDYPVLAIGATRHGTRADSRTPTCTS